MRTVKYFMTFIVYLYSMQKENILKDRMMYLWFTEDVVSSLAKNKDRILLRIRAGNGLVVLCTRKGYRYEMDEKDYSNNIGMLINK